MDIREIKKCRICGNDQIVTVLDLGNQALSGRFPGEDDPDPPRAPLVLIRCDNSKNPGACGLVQLKHSVPPLEMYTCGYGYRSGINKTMRDHLAELTRKSQTITRLEKQDIVLDIGSNDGTLLKSYSMEDIRRIGIDPGGEQYKKYYPQEIQLICDFFSAAKFNSVYPHEKAKIITSVAMFYDLEKPMEFVENIQQILHKDGIWILEQSYLPTMLKMNSFDTICHEHLEYYAFYQIDWMLRRNNLKAVDIEFNAINGGSFRVYVTHADSKIPRNEAALDRVIKMERALKLNCEIPYRDFCTRVEKVKMDLNTFLRTEKTKGKTIFVYGASTKGNVLLQYFNLDSKIITAAAERNPEKWGCRTPGTGIPIISEAEARKQKPDYFLPLPWHFKKEFIEREGQFIKDGGKFIFPLPDVEIV
ncbi:class I SAM-dependent methyltransferase [Methanoregula sp. UBA64]|jgi:NDP-4-keto-2,6-dideoxyhexose 3-C-methyltransferase|uniref:class I SAM-dependent methyltransferase n=1 Tax=Methanoregula sp. UBA64 TaxID=1915554 RepID=UPI0025F671CC|nr:class I SAM-dependent methyltransferase [Methanoregula sp. UBA64]